MTKSVMCEKVCEILYFFYFYFKKVVLRKKIKKGLIFHIFTHFSHQMLQNCYIFCDFVTFL